MTDDSTYYDRAEFLTAARSPEYANSPRYREEVAAKLARSMEAGTVSPMGQYIQHGNVHRGEGDTIHERRPTQTAEGVYGSYNPMPGADPVWAEAAKVGSGYFETQADIARAASAPHYAVDAGYRAAFDAKVARSIREGFLTADWEPADPSKRFARP